MRWLLAEVALRASGAIKGAMFRNTDLAKTQRIARIAQAAREARDHILDEVRDEDTEMPVWTLVVGSQPTYAFSADDQTTAERHLESGGLKDDLSYYEDDEGRPLWDGEGSLSLRLATPNEHRTWRQAQEHPSLDAMIDRQDPEDCATYLVSIHDPADDDVVDL